MDPDTNLIGSPITIAELKALGRFVRWQEIDSLVKELVAQNRLPQRYPLMPSRLPTKGAIDVFDGRRWRTVKFVRMEGSRLAGDRRIVYSEAGDEKAIRYDWYGVAPAGYFTDWRGLRPASLEKIELREGFELAQQGHVIHSQSIVEENWPYLTFEVASFQRDARWVDREDMWTGLYTIHAADPRVRVEGIVPREPWFNTTIAVSHRWLNAQHPDPDGTQYRELMTICDQLGLHENQLLLIDYCSLPQQPHTSDEAKWFHANLPGFQSQFKYVSLVLNTGSADYASRAWCVFELMLAGANRARQTTLLNSDGLDEHLHDAKRLAETYLQESVWNQQLMSRSFTGGLTSASFSKWARDPINVALYNATVDGRSAIIEKFQSELAVTDPNDRPVIVSLIEKLLFEES
jgi:hypothetical protein